MSSNRFFWDVGQATVVDASQFVDHFSDEQPRDPKGTSTGGQWSSGGGAPSQYSQDKLSEILKAAARTELKPEALERYNEIMGGVKSGEELKAIFGGNTEKYKKGGISIDQYDNLVVNLADGENVSAIMRKFSLNSKDVEHSYFVIKPGSQGKNVAKEILSNSMTAYADMGVETVILSANMEVGGYAWAKYGFKPTDKEWKSAKTSFSTNLDRIAQKSLFDFNKPSAGVQALRNLIASPDPRAIWAISDSVLGKELLKGSDWVGFLKLKDTEAMERFNDYVQ